jgi:hypothetical protein
MQLIQHRINTVEQLRQVPPENGVELDIRYYNNELIIHHDPFVPGQNWSDYLAAYQHRFMIANIKSEGVEAEVIRQLAAKNIDNYFLLDVSLPFMIKYIRQGFRKMAIRYSEYEPLEFVQRFQGLVDWVWLDCFTPQPFSAEAYNYLKQHFNICLVSPELQGHSDTVLQQFMAQVRQYPVDAVCTKRVGDWGEVNQSC